MKKIINEDIVRFLSQIELFKELTTDELNLFAKIVKFEDFEANEVIIREGDNGDTLYVLFQGTVEIQKTTTYGDEYTVTLLSERMNCFFGEVSLLDNGSRSATVRARSPVETLVISRDDFNSFCETNKTIGYKLLKGITQRLCFSIRKANKDLIVLFEALVDEIGQGKT